jgi:hypothetical protein
MPLTRDQFGLAEKVLLELQDALANAGFVEPFTTAAAEAAAVVASYTGAYSLATAHTQRLERALAIFDLYSKLGTIPEAVQKACDEALKELRDIRDGKFSSLQSSTGDTANSTGAWGSRTKLTFPGDTTD